MSHLHDWLGNEPHQRSALPQGIAWLIILGPALALSTFFFLHAMGIDPPDQQDMQLPIFSLRFIVILVGAVLLEETIFRFGCLGAARIISTNITWILCVTIASSAVFGYLHGNAVNIAIQGTAG